MRLVACDDRVQRGPVTRSGLTARMSVEGASSRDLVTRVLAAHAKKIDQQRLILYGAAPLSVP